MPSHPPTSGLPHLTLQNLEQHMVWVEGGSFNLASDYNVTLSDFFLCRYPVTQSLWREIMGTDPEELNFTGSDRPLETVHWYDAVTFCNRLSEGCGLDPAYLINPHTKDPHNKNYFDYMKWSVFLIPNAKGYRLPTEAEWEYASRGGKYDRGFEYSGSADLDEVGWYGNNSYSETQPAACKVPNALGLYDLSGNVWEWCQDWYARYPSGPHTNPTGQDFGERRVSRGGSWGLGSDYACVSRFSTAFARVSFRGDGESFPGDRGNSIGFRLAQSI